jgi:ribosomal protein S18 acetylase RimI-like enzyme
MRKQGLEHGNKGEFRTALGCGDPAFRYVQGCSYFPSILFLKTVAELDAEPPDYWVAEIKSAKWAVAQRGGEVVGVVASKRPAPGVDRENPATSRYIESVWVAPGLRRRRLGERLIKYLLTAEYWNNPYIKQFVLWVYETTPLP